MDRDLEVGVWKNGPSGSQSLPGLFGVQVGRNAISFDIKKDSPIYTIYSYQMEYGVSGSKCQDLE